jgi:hypothetical protein
VPPEALRLESGSEATSSSGIVLNPAPSFPGANVVVLKASGEGGGWQIWGKERLFLQWALPVAEYIPTTSDVIVYIPGRSAPTPSEIWHVSLKELSSIEPLKAWIQAGSSQKEEANVDRYSWVFEIAESPKREASETTPALATERTVLPEATKRLAGYEKVLDKVCFLAEEEARARGLTLVRINIRPTWSHESEERTGVVIDAEVKATAEEQSRYWDAVCERLTQLEESASPEEYRFLTNDVFFVVSRG